MFTHCEDCKWSRLNSNPMEGTHLECMHSPPDPQGKRPAVGGRDYCSYGQPNVSEELKQAATAYVPGSNMAGGEVSQRANKAARDATARAQADYEEKVTHIPAGSVLPSLPERDYKSLFYQMRQVLIKLQCNVQEPGVAIEYVQDTLEDILRKGNQTLEEYLGHHPGHARELARLDKCMKEKKS